MPKRVLFHGASCPFEEFSAALIGTGGDPNSELGAFTSELICVADEFADTAAALKGGEGAIMAVITDDFTPENARHVFSHDEFYGEGVDPDEDRACFKELRQDFLEEGVSFLEFEGGEDPYTVIIDLSVIDSVHVLTREQVKVLKAQEESGVRLTITNFHEVISMQEQSASIVVSDEERAELAEALYEAYDFGEDWMVTDTGHFDTNSAERWERVVYLTSLDDELGQTVRTSFHVDFSPEGVPIGTAAYFVDTGNEFGECKTAETLWEMLEDIPIDENDKTEKKFLSFEVGTGKYDIWHWFEDQLGVSVAELLHGVSGVASKEQELAL